MIVLGGLVGGPGVTSFGWIVLLTTIGVRLIVALLGSWLAYGRWKLGVGVAAIVIVGLVVYGLVSGVAGRVPSPCSGSVWSSVSSWPRCRPWCVGGRR